MRLLLVEDDPRVARLVERGLTEAGHAVEVAHDGVAALALAEGGGYDLIVLDVLLPELDGLAVCRRLREQGMRTPILMLTARDAVPDRVRGLDAGADDYLVKPFALEELQARLRALGRRSAGGERGEALRYADLVVDVLGHTVCRGRRAIELTRTEFLLLELF